VLAPDEPFPVEVFRAKARSSFVIVCDHAGRELPRGLGTLGLSPEELQSHIAWDIGARGVARRLADLLDAALVLQRYSRLVIDCNRPLSAPDSIVLKSGGIPVLGNQALTRAEAEERARSIFKPYHAQIRSILNEREAHGQPSLLVALHTFTPELLGVPRPWHTGILYHRDTRLALPLLDLLRQEPGLVVGDNEPYRASDSSDLSIIEHGERRGLPYVEIEIRQDLVSDETGQVAWAERFARLLPAAISKSELATRKQR
jgi:predicted N-formylglutamate amidohydrolase